MTVQVILKNSSVSGKEPTGGQLANGELALNYHADGPFITCKDTAGTIRRVAGTNLGAQNVVTTGTNTAGSFIPTGSTVPSSGVYAPSSGILGISTGGTGRLFIDSSGNVGIGITSQILFIDKELNVNAASGSSGFSLATAGAARVYLTGNSTTGNITTKGSIPLLFGTNELERLRIDSSGRVGIGTSSPSQLLTVNGSNFVGSSFNGQAIGDVSAERIRIGYKDGSPDTGLVPAQILVDASILSIAARDTPASAIRFYTGSGINERVCIDSSGRLLVGTSTVTGDSTFSTAEFVKNTFCEVNVGRFSSSIVSGDGIGRIAFNSYAGGVWQPHASIACVADANSASGDKPGRLEFSTTADGAASPTERFRITNDGVIAHDQPAPAAVNATATLTIANLKAGIITSTSATATDMTLPTGTNTQAGFSGTYDNFTFKWSVINTGPSLVRVLAGTAHSIVGSGSVATGTSGSFASRRTAANTFVTYRLA